MDWRQAGRGWGAHPLEWAYLFEPFMRPANQVLFDRLGVGSGTRLLDVACGSGLAANTASCRGAGVTGIDASEALVDVALARTPDGDFRVGDMFALPFDDDSFDVVTSFNGIWNKCEGALSEARRVLVAGGQFGISFWGDFDKLGLMPYFMKIIELSPPSHQTATMDQGQTSQVVLDMLNATGFAIREQGTVDVVNEWPDVSTAVRALAAAGPAVPAIEAAGYEAFCDALHDVLAPMYDPRVGVRVTSQLGWVVSNAV